jgi:hypothetical protein
LLPSGLVGLFAKFDNLRSAKPSAKEPAYGAP